MGDFDLTLVIGETRLARDERVAELAPLDLTFSTTSQGGPKQLDCSLLRSLRYDGRERLFDPVVLFDPVGETVWPGRLQRMPRTINRRTQRQAPQALGLAAIMEDNQAARALFMDRDLGRSWRGMTTPRQIAINTASFRPGSHSVGNGGLKLGVQGYQWSTAAGRPYVEAVYDAGPLRVGQVLGHWETTGNASIQPDTAWELRPFVADDPDVTVNVGVGANLNTGAVAGADFTIAAGHRMAGLLLDYVNAPAGSTAATWEVTLSNVVVVGDHGLPLVGTGPADFGVKASDAWRWLIDTYCPGLTPGNIVDSQIGIQHLAFPDPQSPGAIWAAINAYHAWAWGVWAGGRVDVNPYGAGTSKTWFVRADDAGVELQQDGDDAAALWTDIVVTYQTPTGESMSVGAPGTIADAHSSALGIDDPFHPAVSAGVRRVYHFALDAPTIRETATAVGQVMLAQLNAARRAGTANLTGYVTDAAGARAPVWKVRGGDLVIVTDVGDDAPRRVVETTYTHATRTVSCTLDNTLQTVEAIVAHLGSRSTGRA